MLSAGHFLALLLDARERRPHIGMCGQGNFSNMTTTNPTSKET
jgi:hypothetical protein